MQINGVPIDKNTLAEITAEVSEKIELLTEEMGCLSEFEAVAAIGFLWFAKNGCDIVCLEVGLGGSCDPTNIIDSPLAAVITPIGLDHTEYLGDTIEKIAAEKAGIIKPMCSAVCCAGQNPEALAVIMERCAETGVTLTTAGAGSITVKSESVLGSDVTYMNTDIHLPLGGAHQLQNLTTALATVEVLRQKGFSIDAAAVKKGIESVSFPARMERLGNSPTVILDGGHNPHGMTAVAKAAHELPLPRVLVLGMLADKDTDAALGIIAPMFDKIITVSVETTPRGLSAEKLCAKALAFNKNVTAVQSHSEALKLAKSLAGKEGSVLICGSLYLASEIRPLLI